MKILTFVLGTCFCISAFTASAQNTYKGGDIVLSASRSFNPSVWRNDEMVFNKPVKIIIPAVVPIAQGNAGNHPVGAIIAFKNANNQKDSIVYKGIADVAKPSSPFNSSQMIKANKFVYNYGSSSIMPGDTVLVTYLKLVANMGDNSDPLQRLFVNVQLKPVEVRETWVMSGNDSVVKTDKRLVVTNAVEARGGLKIGDSSIYIGKLIQRSDNSPYNDNNSIFYFNANDNSAAKAGDNAISATGGDMYINTYTVAQKSTSVSSFSYKKPQNTIINGNSSKDSYGVNMNGNVGIGTSNLLTNFKLTVLGGMNVDKISSNQLLLSDPANPITLDNGYIAKVVGGLSVDNLKSGKLILAGCNIEEKGTGSNRYLQFLAPSSIKSFSFSEPVIAPEFRACLDPSTTCPPDYVFEESYDLMHLSKLEKYIHANKHLPEIPSAQQMLDKGLNMSEMNLLLLKKVEELTLYVLQMNKELQKLKK